MKRVLIFCERRLMVDGIDVTVNENILKDNLSFII